MCVVRKALPAGLGKERERERERERDEACEHDSLHARFG